MTLRSRTQQLLRSVRQRFPRYSSQSIGKAVSTALEDFRKRRRGVVTQQYIETVDKIVDQPWPYKLLKSYANKHPFLRIVHGAVIREVVRNRWDVQEKFAKKCTGCGQEFKEMVDTCPDCGVAGLLRDPNPVGKTVLENFLKNPNRDDELIDIVKSLLKDNLAVDDWYLSIGNSNGVITIYNEDSSEIFLCADRHGRLGNGVWFCSNCWTAMDNEVGGHEKTYPRKGSCPECGGLLTETAYVQKREGTVKARFGRHEIIHGNSDPWLPQMYGNSKVASVITELRTAYAMGSFNFDVYSKGVIEKLIVLKGEAQGKADEIAASAKEQREKLDIDAWTGRVGRKTGGSLFIGANEGTEIHDMMPDPQKMQSLDWMEFWFVKIVGGIYGVQPVMINAPTRGPGGYFQRMQIVVQNDRTREDQAMIEDSLNEQLLPLLGVHDWLFKFNEVEPRNEIEQAQIWQSKVAAGTLAVEAGLKAELTDEGELKISGEFVKPEIPSQATGYMMPRPPKVPQPEQAPSFSTKGKRGKSWIVTEVNSDSASGKSGS